MDHTEPAGGERRPGRRWWTLDAVPLAASVALHAGALVLGVVVYQAVQSLPTPRREQVVIPQTASLARPASAGGLARPGLPAVDPTTELRQDRTAGGDAVGFDVADDRLAPASIGLGPATHARQASGRGTAAGAAPWGPPGGGGEGVAPRGVDGRLFQGNGNAIVFLCDASGSMLGVFGQLKQELKGAISQLAVDDQGAMRFDVVFFRDGRVSRLFADGMHVATPDAKRAATTFIDAQVSAGGTDPTPAIRAALAERPDLLFVLTDGFDQVADLSAVVDQFRRGNPDGRVHVNCVYLQGDQTDDPKLVAALRRIAADGRGTFRAVVKKDM